MKYGKQKRTAVVIVAVVVMILCIAAFKMPYPFTIEADGIIVNNNLPGRENYAICMLVPYRYKEFLQARVACGRTPASSCVELAPASSDEVCALLSVSPALLLSP